MSFFPANIAAANSPSQQALPFMNVFVESMQWGRSSTVIPIAHPHFWRAYQEAWDAVMRDDKTPREALTNAVAEVQKALDSQLAYDRFYQNYLAEKLGPASGGADGGEGSG